MTAVTHDTRHNGFSLPIDNGLGYDRTTESSTQPRHHTPMPNPQQNNTPPTDAALMARIGAGDRAAYTILVDRHMIRALHFVFRHVRDTMVAEDILQEGCIKLWQHAATWEPQAQFTTWFYRLLYHLCVDYWRRNKRPMESVDDMAELLADAAPLAEQQLITTQQNQSLYAALEQLPDTQRTALMLFHLQELSQFQVAEIMQISVGAVESLLFRGRQKIRQLLQGPDNKTAAAKKTKQQGERS